MSDRQLTAIIDFARRQSKPQDADAERALWRSIIDTFGHVDDLLDLIDDNYQMIHAAMLKTEVAQ